MKEAEKKYNLSFTAGAAMLNEMHAVAETLRGNGGGNWEITRDITLRENLMEKNRFSTRQRVFSLMRQRISTLNEEELNILIDGNMAARRQIVLLAVCKAHPFIFDFIRDNVREAFYSMRERVTYADFNEFFNDKRFVHPELEAASEATIAKIRQVVFRIMEQTELVESAKSGIIRRPYLSEMTEHAVAKDNPAWLSIYLYSNNEIVLLANTYS